MGEWSTVSSQVLLTALFKLNETAATFFAQYPVSGMAAATTQIFGNAVYSLISEYTVPTVTLPGATTVPEQQVWQYSLPTLVLVYSPAAVLSVLIALGSVIYRKRGMRVGTETTFTDLGKATSCSSVQNVWEDKRARLRFDGQLFKRE